MADRKPDMDVTVQQGLRELMQDDYPLLLETFLADAGKRLRQLHDALAQGDMNAYRQAAHSFKGSAGNFFGMVQRAFWTQSSKYARVKKIELWMRVPALKHNS